jgi:hypothetical protein
MSQRKRWDEKGANLVKKWEIEIGTSKSSFAGSLRQSREYMPEVEMSVWRMMEHILNRC